MPEEVNNKEINPYEIVQGKIPSQNDMASWSERKWLSFLEWFERYLITEGSNERAKVTLEIMKKMETETRAFSHPWCEFMYRVNVWSYKDAPSAFIWRLNNMVRQCLTFLKRHPATISADMRTIMERHQRMSKYLLQYSVMKTEAGEVMQRDNRITSPDGSQQTVKLPSIQAKVASTLMNVADILESLSEGISKKDLKAMSAKDKISAISKLLGPVANLATKKITQNHFTTINLNATSVADAEKKMLEFSKLRQE